MPTLTPHSTMDPQPRVDVLFESGDLDVAVETITVYQISEYGQITVRDAEGVSAVGGFSVTDYEVPPGVTVTYQAQQYDSTGAVLGLTDATDTSVTIEAGYLVFSDPLAPANAVLVDGRDTFAEIVAEARPRQRYQVGRSTIVLTGELGLREGVSLAVSTRTLSDADTLRAILQESPVLVRTMPNIVRIPGSFYASVADIRQVPIDVQYGGEWIVWDLVGDEVSRPSIATLVPAVTYQTYVTFYTGDTYGDTLTEYTTYLDSIANPPPEA